jgi:hypothetical protein
LRSFPQPLRPFWHPSKSLPETSRSFWHPSISGTCKCWVNPSLGLPARLSHWVGKQTDRQTDRLQGREEGRQSGF